jgi:copper chaperone
MIELTLPDMTCGHCVKTVTSTLQRLDPNAKVRCELPTHKVTVESSLPRERIEQALAIQGYPAAAVP